MTTTITPSAYKVSFSVLTINGSESRSTKWYPRVEDIPAAYMASVGVVYDSEAPVLYFDGVLEYRPQDGSPINPTAAGAAIQAYILGELGIASDVAICADGVAIKVGSFHSAATLLRKFMRHGCMLKASGFNEFHLWIEGNAMGRITPEVVMGAPYPVNVRSIAAIAWP